MTAFFLILALLEPALSAAASAPTVWLVLPDDLRDAAGWEALPDTYEVRSLERLSADSLVAHAAGGGSFIWLGPPERVPAELWIGAFRPSDAPLQIDAAPSSPLDLGSIELRPARAWSAFIKPTQEIPYHNVVEEPRADLLPLLEARDRFGTVVGYPAVLFSHYAASLAAGRFAGSRQLYFFIDDPLVAQDIAAWVGLLQRIAPWFESRLQLTHLGTTYASYHIGERVHVQATIANRRPVAAAATVDLLVRSPVDKAFRRISSSRSVPAAGDTLTVAAEFVPNRPGPLIVRAEVRQDVSRAPELSAAGNPVPLEWRDVGVLVHDGLKAAGPVVGVSGLNLALDGEAALFVGTHYYPSTSWWDGAWTDMRPLLVDRDLAAMRRAGYRIIRIWVDPVLDERTLRAMDVVMLLAARHGLAVDLCVFTQWGPTVTYQREDGSLVDVVLRSEKDFNVYGISLRDLDGQRQYLTRIAARWKSLPHVVFNLSNETYVRDPDTGQMDAEAAAWDESRMPLSFERDTALFRRWARAMTEAIRASGAGQPVIVGHTFAMQGGADSYRANRDGAIAPLHSYGEPAETGALLSYVDPACTGRPLMLEEFGTTGWNDAAHYDAVLHYALAAGVSAALSYEWGVSWMAPELPPHPTFLRQEWGADPDPRWFAAIGGFARMWPSRSSGFFPAASGFPFGSAYHGTSFPAEAAAAVGRLHGFGSLLARADRTVGVPVLVPVTDSRDRMARLYAHFKRFWEEHIPYHVIQHDCPVPDGALRLTEADVDPDRWSALPRVHVAPSSVRMIARATRTGVLYSLFGPVDLVELRADGFEASLGAEPYGMVLIGSRGPVLAEASSRLVIDGQVVFTVDRGRLLVSTDGTGSILDAGSLRIRASEPATVVFQRPIREVRVWRADLDEPVAVEGRTGTSLAIDAEMVPYDLEVLFR